jgi:DNA-binding NarL/FixJ family response regulator
LTARCQRSPPASPRHSRWQTQVLRLIAAGYRNKQISRVLGIALKTVSCHRYQLMTKLDVGGVAELTRYAIRAGLIEPKSGS